jgi:hypothetical protein
MKFGHATLEDHRPLADSELDAVSGGWLPSGIPGTGGTVPITGGNLYVGETVGGRRIQKFL